MLDRGRNHLEKGKAYLWSEFYILACCEFSFKPAICIFLPAVTHRGYTDHISFLIADREVQIYRMEIECSWSELNWVVKLHSSKCSSVEAGTEGQRACLERRKHRGVRNARCMILLWLAIAQGKRIKQLMCLGREMQFRNTAPLWWQLKPRREGRSKEKCWCHLFNFAYFTSCSTLRNTSRSWFV